MSIEAAEHERARWARELHDETLQGLGALQVMLTSVLQRDDGEAAKQTARDAVDHVAQEIEKLQSLITELRPTALDDIGLTPALESLIERVRNIHGLDVVGQIELNQLAGQEEARLQPELESTAYRLVQEALTNIAKHARAEDVQVVVGESEGHVAIEVRDDGRGFDPAGGQRVRACRHARARRPRRRQPDH